MKASMDCFVVFFSDLVSDTDRGYRRSCWASYSALLLCWSMVLLDVLFGWALVALFLALVFAAWRIEKAAGTPYSWHFGNLIACLVTTFWSVAVFHAILRSMEGRIQTLAHAGVILIAIVLAVMCAYGIFNLVRGKQGHLI